MDTLIDFFSFVISAAFLGFIALCIIALLGYNKLRSLSETIKESWSNTGVVGRKQASLINQLIDVVKGYQESEKLVMLKVSDDMTNPAGVAQLHQQAGSVLSTVNGLAERFPELKANQQYQRLIDSVQACEADLEKARAHYNSAVRAYNTSRSSIPTVFYASRLGFNSASYLEFDSSGESMDPQTFRSFADNDGERLGKLLGDAGSRIRESSGKVLEAGKSAAAKAIESGRQNLDHTASDRAEVNNSEPNSPP